jgi:hypothetical protein
MDTANLLANIWGISLVIIPLSLLVDPKQVKNLFTAMEKETNVYICGVVSFILGVITVLLNNIWAADWRVIITLIGWIAILRGLFGMFWTQGATKLCSKAKDKGWIQYIILGVLILGLIFIYFGFVGK